LIVSCGFSYLVLLVFRAKGTIVGSTSATVSPDIQQPGRRPGGHGGLLKTVAKVAVASSVHGRIQRRQQQRWAAQDQANGATAPPLSPPQHAVPALSAGINDRRAQLKQLG
jgi:hypothetical protein